METWINDTLLDAGETNTLKIPGAILKTDSKEPLVLYGIGRHELMGYSIPEKTIDRIYRALFVYSLGFYELLKRSTNHCE